MYSYFSNGKLNICRNSGLEVVLSEAWFQLGTSLWQNMITKASDSSQTTGGAAKGKLGVKQAASTVVQKPATEGSAVVKPCPRVLEALVESAKHAFNASKSDLVTRAVRQYWNMVCYLMGNRDERCSHFDQIKILLKYIRSIETVNKV